MRKQQNIALKLPCRIPLELRKLQKKMNTDKPSPDENNHEQKGCQHRPEDAVCLVYHSLSFLTLALKVF